MNIKKPTLLKATGLVLLVLLVLGVATGAFDKALTATADGTLEPVFQEVTETKDGKVRTHYYEIVYHFFADGRLYSGTSSVGKRPATLAIKVHYDPQDPAQNSLQDHRLRVELPTLFGVAGLLCLLLARFV